MIGGGTISVEFLIEISTSILSIVAVLATTLTYVRKKSEKDLKDRYNIEKHMVELDYMRKNLEMQLYEVSKKLEENEKRWRDVNHLVITSQNRQAESNFTKSSVTPNDFLKNLGISESKDFEIDNNQVFVLSPFNDIYRDTFYTIRGVCEKLNLKCYRGDEQYVPNEIFPTILKQIIKSRFLIANITGRNPNVMYELGVAHALGKPTIIIAQNFADVPFDLNNKRIIIYDNNGDLKDKLELSITDMLVSKII